MTCSWVCHKSCWKIPSGKRDFRRAPVLCKSNGFGLSLIILQLQLFVYCYYPFILVIDLCFSLPTNLLSPLFSFSNHTLRLVSLPSRLRLFRLKYKMPVIFQTSSGYTSNQGATFSWSTTTQWSQWTDIGNTSGKRNTHHGCLEHTHLNKVECNMNNFMLGNQLHSVRSCGVFFFFFSFAFHLEHSFTPLIHLIGFACPCSS